MQYSVSNIAKAQLIKTEVKLLSWLSSGDLSSSVPNRRDCATAAYDLLLASAGT